MKERPLDRIEEQHAIIPFPRSPLKMPVRVGVLVQELLDSIQLTTLEVDDDGSPNNEKSS